MRTFRILLFCIIAASGNLVAFGDPNGPIAIVGAFDEEVSLLQSKLVDKHSTTFLGLKFVRGLLNGKDVVVAATGMGKVNAAMTTTIILENFHPRALIFSGIAGGIVPTLRPGDVVIGLKLIQYDYGIINDSGFKTGPTVDPITEKDNPLFFESAPELLEIAFKAGKKAKLNALHGHNPTVTSGIIATGDAFVASAAKCTELNQKFKAIAVEMEGAAVAQICYQQKCPFIVIRSISDNADSNAHEDIQKFYRTAAANSAELVSDIAGLMP